MDWVEESGEDILESSFRKMIVQGIHMDGIVSIDLSGSSYSNRVRLALHLCPTSSSSWAQDLALRQYRIDLRHRTCREVYNRPCGSWAKVEYRVQADLSDAIECHSPFGLLNSDFWLGLPGSLRRSLTISDLPGKLCHLQAVNLRPL